MKILFKHHKQMVLDIGGHKQTVRRSYRVNKILMMAPVKKKISAYHVQIDLNNPEIIISKLALSSSRKSREPELYLSAYIAGKDIIMVGCDLFNGRQFTFKEALFFRDRGETFTRISKKDTDMQTLEQAYKSADVLMRM